ncbi:flavin reductase family protein [Margalitia sp. FSL K6-0131]|uniref:flavin reductase family protein n=1 Tax=Margalitia sp. FSL K6-0131 TaxID=2954604 RepID=UPI0030FCC7F2
MDVRELRNCFGRFATGVTVVTWNGEDGQRYGITVNSFTSVSLEPPLVLISIDRNAKACKSLKGRPFIINILTKKQEKLAWQFAGKPQQDLTIDWEETPLGPKLKATLATIECTHWQEYEAGDHILYLGKVSHSSYNTGDGLIFYQGKFLQTAAT